MRKLFVFVALVLTIIVNSNVWAVGVIASNVVCDPPGCVDASDIAANAVETAKIADVNVTESKLAPNAVTASKLADWSVSSAKIVDFSVTDTKLSTDAVTSAKIADGAVTDAKITGPISASKLAGTIGVENLGVYAGTKIVHKGATDNVNTFNTITAAIQSIGINTTDRYAIIVMPGTYSEDFTFLNPSGIRYNIDIVGQSRTGTIVKPLGNDYRGFGSAIHLADGIVLKNVTIDGLVEISSSNDVALLNSTIKTSVSGYGIASHYPTNVTIENIIIEVNDNGLGMWLYHYERSRNINLNNITIKLANGASGIWVFPDWGDDPIRFTNLRISGTSSGYGMGLFSYTSGVVELDNLFIEDTLNAFHYDGGAVNVRATNCKFMNTGELVYGGGGNNLTITIDNSIIKSSVTSTASPVKIGGSKIYGPLTSANGQVKIINSYDGNYDPIPNGLY